MRKGGGSDIAKENAYLIMGPWTHMNFTGKINEFDFGSEASEEAINLIDIKIAWYDHWLKNKKRKYLLNKPVKIFVMGENKWREEDDWPLLKTNYTPFYFHSEGNANIKNGSLSTEKPNNEISDKFIYDPLNPVPTLGGQVILPGEGSMGPRDQSKVENRDDVLVYETSILKEDVTVIGPLIANLFISSDCKDTDFTVKLTDVDEKNISRLLSDGILRVRYRNSLEKTELMEPGKIYEIKVNVAATANTFLKGHRIRVSVSSSNFPRFNRNSNSGGDIMFEEVSSYKKANNVVFHDSEHPSCIILPIIAK
jgi:putative CocE/NonD family hydrolase